MKQLRKMLMGLLLFGIIAAKTEVYAMDVETLVETESLTETIEDELVIESETETVIESESELETESVVEETVILQEDSVEIPVTDTSESKVNISEYENQGVAQFVDRMYEKFLNREADPEGFDYWYNKLVSGEFEGANIIDGFAASKEFENLGLDSDAYFEIMYQGIFDRAPDETGLATWTPIYNSGVSASYIPAQFVGSAEFTALCEKFNISRGSITLSQNRDKDPTITQFVSHFYEECLDREGDECGLNDWTGQLLEKVSTGADISYGFVYSKEFQNKNLNDKEFVAVLYQTLLMRKADALGLNDWVNRLDQGVSNEYIRAGFVHSVEFDTFCKEHNIARGNVILTEARDQHYDLTVTVKTLYEQANKVKPTGEQLNDILEPMYKGEVSGHEMVSNLTSKSSFQMMTDQEFIEAIYKIVLKREATPDEITAALANTEKESREFALDRILIGKEFSDLCKAYGIELMDYMDIPAMKYAKEILDELNWNLEAGFKWSYTGIRYQHVPKPAKGVSHTQYYGKYGFEKRVGNCYAMASAFYWMAKINGWDVYLVEGYVPTSGGGLAVHGWLEVEVDGEIYVCDPSGARKGLEGYMIQYGQKGTYMYKNYERYD